MSSDKWRKQIKLKKMLQAEKQYVYKYFFTDV